VGFDDLEISQYLTPGLTTVKQQISLKGQKAVELLLKHIEDPALPKQEEILPLELIRRGSVKRLD
jgi:DNA-binding LacI/PurR family transcriptional regulator